MEGEKEEKREGELSQAAKSKSASLKGKRRGKLDKAQSGIGEESWRKEEEIARFIPFTRVMTSAGGSAVRWFNKACE